MTDCKDKLRLMSATRRLMFLPSPSQVLNIIDFFIYLFFQRDNTQADMTVPIKHFPYCKQYVISYHLCLFSH